MTRLSSITVFFPSLNDAKILPYLITRLYSILPQVSSNYEVIVINDGSTDETNEILANIKKHYRHFRFLSHKKNKGYGGALKTGFKHARKDWIFYTDGDGQYDPVELLLLSKKASPKVDVINGYKLSRNDNMIRSLLGTIYNKALHAVYDIPISDVDCDFRLIRKSILRKIDLTSNSGSICYELISKLHKNNAHFKEVGVHHYPRLFGKSQFFNLRNLIKTFHEHRQFFQDNKVK